MLKGAMTAHKAMSVTTEAVLLLGIDNQGGRPHIAPVSLTAITTKKYKRICNYTVAFKFIWFSLL